MKYCFLLLALFAWSIVKTQPPNLVLPNGHTDHVNTAVFSPNDKTALTASSDGTAKLWDVNSGALLYTLTQHRGGLFSAKFSTDGKRIITASVDSTAIIWNTETAEPITVLKDKTGSVFFASFFSNNTKLVTVSTKGIVQTWNALTGALLTTSKNANTKIISACAIASKEKMIATVCEDNYAIIYNLNSEMLWKLEGHTSKINAIAFSNDNKKIITASADKTAIVWSTNSGKQIVTIKGNSSDITTVAFSPDNKKVITVTWDGTCKIWNAENGEFICTLQDVQGLVTSAIFSPDSKKVITCSYAKVKISDAETGKIILPLVGHIITVRAANFSTDGKKIITAGNDRTAKIWNAKTGSLERDLKSKVLYFNCASYSPIGSKIVAGFEENSAKIWNLYSGELTTVLRGHKWRVTTTKFSNNGEKVVTGSVDSTARIFDAKSGKQLTILYGHTGTIHDAIFSSNDRMVVTASQDNTARVWSVETGKQLFILQGHRAAVNAVAYSRSGLLIATASNDKSIKIWNAYSGKTVYTLNNHSARVLNLTFSKNEQRLLSCSADGTISCWDLVTGKLESEFKGHQAAVTHVSFVGDEEDGLLSASNDNSIKIWEIKSGNCLRTIGLGANTFFRGFSPHIGHVIATSNTTLKLFSIGDTSLNLLASIYTMIDAKIDFKEYAMVLTNGYFKATPNAAKLMHYVTNDFKIVNFDQLDVKYNRPDKVLEALGNLDTLLIKSYRNAYNKRVKKLAIDTLQFNDGFNVPELNFVKKDAIEYEQNNNKLTIQLKGYDSIYLLDKFNVWVNEVPLFGLRGIKIKRNNNFDTTIIITLSQGENRIETSVINVNGTESYKMPLFVKYSPAKPIEEKQYFIGIGINQFANTDYNLSWGVKDIRDLALKLKTKYPNIIIDTLFDNNVTRENILALKQKLLQFNEEDKVIISYSGHGVLSKDFDYYLSTYSINFNNPAEKGLAYDDLESLLDNIKPRKKLMLIDACHSGEVDKDEIARIEASKKRLDSTGIVYKSSFKAVPKKKVGMANSFELMQNLFVNVSKGTGATIISAAGGMQYAQERGDLKNGVFTYSLIEAFNQNQTIKVSELKKKVGERVLQLTDGLQKPTSRNETNNYDWVIW